MWRHTPPLRNGTHEKRHGGLTVRLRELKTVVRQRFLSFAIVRVRMRETCICETPISVAIWSLCHRGRRISSRRSVVLDRRALQEVNHGFVIGDCLQLPVEVTDGVCDTTPFAVAITVGHRRVEI